jgi:CheY-like chemotaxis protein
MLPAILSAVLLVDDDPTANFLNQRLLSRLNVSREVYVAQNGVEALTQLTTHCQANSVSCPALVLLDLNMPVMDGFQFLEAYQHLAVGTRQGTRIVVLTSSMLPADQERARHLSVAAFLNKPLTKEGLGALLHEQFGFPVAA